jgi:hypothetical protein
MLCQLVSQLQPSQVTKASTNRFGMALKGATAPSQANSPISKNCSTTTQEGQGIIVYAHIARSCQQSPIATITT